MIHSRARGILAPLGFAAVALIALAFSPGSTVADDSEDCAVCHEQLGQAFRATIHGRIQGFEVQSGQVGCTSCHGDGTAHMDGDGDPARIVRFGDETTAEEVSKVCMTCHKSDSLHDWDGSTHPLNGVGCTDCHRVHATPDRAERYTDTCLECHQDARAQFNYPSHHPVREGQMSCTSCHNPHGSNTGLLKNDERPEELCLTCHTHLAGPFIFEHEPIAEGCDTCHTPHGSVADNLLVQNEPFLCLQCHELHFHAALEGEAESEFYVPRYDPEFDPDVERETYPGGMVPNNGPNSFRQAFTTKCTQCHTRVHGTDLPSQAVPGQGGGLMR